MMQAQGLIEADIVLLTHRMSGAEQEIADLKVHVESLQMDLDYLWAREARRNGRWMRFIRWFKRTREWYARQFIAGLGV